jgi:hypothetical protein
MVRDERGQALALLVAALGFAALVVSALIDADNRLMNRLHALRAAEAAAEAAGGVASDRMLELRAEAVVEHRTADVIEAALADPLLAVRAEAAAREVLVLLDGELTHLSLTRRSDELSAKAEVRARGAAGLARVGVRSP